MTAEEVNDVWQKAIPEVAWGTVALFVGIVLGYVGVFCGVFFDFLTLPIASIFCIGLCYASFTVVHDAGHGNVISLSSGCKFFESFMGGAPLYHYC